MTHDACIEAVIARLRGRNPPEASVQATPTAVEEHLAGCSDCWAVVELLHETVRGEPARQHDRMMTLYGCESVRDRFHVLVDMTAAELMRRDPTAARHLAWCQACRDRFGAYTAIEHDVASRAATAVEEPGSARALRDIAGRVVVAVRSGFATFTELAGAVPIEAFASAAARSDRGAAGTSTVRLASGRHGIGANLTVLPRSDGRMDLEVLLLESVPAGTMVWLRTADGNETIACQTARSNEPVVFGAVPPGRYLVELPGTPPVYIEIDVGRADV
jgi:hypothetical protein